MRVGGRLPSGRWLKLVTHETGRIAPADDPHRERIFRSERYWCRWSVERNGFGPAFSQEHRGESASQIVFAADMELREIDAVHVAEGGLVNDSNTHFWRTSPLVGRLSSIDASKN